MKTKIFLCTTLFFILSPLAFAAPCHISNVEKEKLLLMSYDAFDQQAEKGWRQYAKLGCYHETGVLIDAYLKQNRATLADWQVANVMWHAGQVYAFNDEAKVAKIRFENSINPNEPKNTPILWNDYVHATIAFLEHDGAKLKLYRDKIANGPTFNGTKANLDVVNRLIQYIGHPYAEAYRANS